MTIHELTREQLVALVRQQAAALDACQREADVRAKTKSPNTTDSMEALHELPAVEATAAKLRKEVIGKGRR